MLLPHSAHLSRPWRIHEMAIDFGLEDVWLLPTPGGPADFPRLVELLAATDPAAGASRMAALLWAVRWKAGGLLGWDDDDTGVGTRVPSLQDRLPADLRDRAQGPAFAHLSFTSLYLTENEWAAEVANETMHGIMHIGWVQTDAGEHRGQMAVLVKPNGALGRVYMAAIKPFRHLVVYPPALRHIERAWRRGDADVLEVSAQGCPDVG